MIESELFADVIVSTDDHEIAEIALKAGASVPFMRPAEISGDYATTADVMSHAVSALKCAANGVEFVCCVYPAAVLITQADLRLGLDALEADLDADFAGAVLRYGHPIQRACSRDSAGRIHLLDPVQANSRTQDFEEAWHDAGQFYWGRSRAWLEKRPYFASAVGIALPSWRIVDLDEEEDWIRAEIAFRILSSQE
jgi:pseudaminic acid cytidylyltransferase